jgi:YVTN family beta-propeller protein
VVANITIPADYAASMLAYGSQDHRIYVSNNSPYSASSTVSVIDDTSNTIIGTVNAGLGPLDLAYDSSNNEIYVTHFPIVSGARTNFVTVISGSSNSIVANITVGVQPAGILYDPANNDIYVADSGSSQVSIISGQTNTVVATVPLKLSAYVSPFGLVYDPANNEILVTNQLPNGGSAASSNVVSIIDGASNRLLGNMTLGYNPSDGVYDPTKGYLYVSNYRSGTVSVLASPVASASSFPTLGIAPLDVQFTGSVLGGTAPYVYLWNFGDGSQTSTLQSPSHQYRASGTYVAVFNITDHLSYTASSQITITVTPPYVSIVSCGRELSCSVRSNATLSNIRFAGVTLHVEADGPLASHGFANVTVPKTAIPNKDNTHIFVDDNKLASSAVTITSNSTAYFIYFTFTFHSPVRIDIQLAAAELTPNSPTILGIDPPLFYSMIALIVAIVVILTAAAHRRSGNRSKEIHTQ